MSDFETWWASVEYKGLYPEASHDWAEEGWNACERKWQNQLFGLELEPPLRVDEDEE